MKMEQTECSETSAYKIQIPGNYPEESIQHSEQDESLKSCIMLLVTDYTLHDLLFPDKCVFGSRVFTTITGHRYGSRQSAQTIIVITVRTFDS